MSLEETQQEPEGSGVQKTPEQFLADEKRSIRRKSYWAVGIGGLLVVAHIGWLAVFALLGADVDLSILLRSIIFILGLFALAAGTYGLFYARRLSLDDLIPSAAAIEFARSSGPVAPYYTLTLLGAMIAAFLVQTSVGIEQSVEGAGLIKERVMINGEYWRLVTAGVLHGSILHIFLNGNAFYGLGGMFEFLSNRAHLAIVFVLSILGGSLASTMGPYGASIGASGGILGIFGYLLVYAMRRKAQLPPGFLKSLLVNVVFIAGFGIIAYQLIDNFAHAGGFLTGAVYAFIQVPKDRDTDPRKVSRTVEILGMIAVAVYLAEALFAVMRITGRA